MSFQLTVVDCCLLTGRSWLTWTTRPERHTWSGRITWIAGITTETPLNLRLRVHYK